MYFVSSLLFFSVKILFILIRWSNYVNPGLFLSCTWNQIFSGWTSSLQIQDKTRRNEQARICKLILFVWYKICSIIL